MRLAGDGLINRERPVEFSFDGHRYSGFEGDTLASALLANDVRLVGRSFKYHRPRGILSAGSEEPNALVTVGTGSEQEPNVRATVLELHDGLSARSQNRWPSLDFDLLGINDLFSSFLGAGFYYKTFMKPKAFWEGLYEPLIRRAAGLGALSGEPTRAHYEKAWAHCDFLIIGAGPAGLMAALTAARAGVDVILADEDTRVGGRLNAERLEVGGQSGVDWAEGLRDELDALPNVRVMTRTSVAGVYDHGSYGAVERLPHDVAARSGAPREIFWRIVARQAVLAAGAIERPVAFANNDRPGVMMASAVRAYVNRWRVSPGQSVAIFGNNDDAHRTAADLVAAGVHVSALIDARHSATTDLDVPFYPGTRVSGAHGRKRLEAVSLLTGERLDRVRADCLAMSGGWNPSVHLTCHKGARPVWDRDKLAFLPKQGAVAGLHTAGACNGDFSTRVCLEGGVRAANAALEALGSPVQAVDIPKAEDSSYDIEPLWFVPGKGRAWLDFQNDVTIKDVKQAAVENFRSVEHMKRYTTQGMATDQGKNSNVLALAILADVTGQGIPETGTTTFRPPFSPVQIATMGAGGRGKGFAPERFLTSHESSLMRNAPMIEAGLWYRASYYPKPGETRWRQSCDREVNMVRSAVGVCDVSTLGKIEIFGPDAGEFLDFVYTNTFSTLKPGRVRYGLMLREDGYVMDDGTTARLSDQHYVMTTTTAAAGEVMRHLDFVQQAFCSALKVRFTSATENWAQFAVAGPRARDLLNAVLDQPLAEADWPFMSCGEVKVGGQNARLFRISFSGEHAYEIAVPARYGAALFDLLLKHAEALGGGAYGMEALNVLRIEKGFITHSEIHGRVTAFDIGMQSMMSKKKDFIGKAMASRPGLIDPAREQLVGLMPLSQEDELTAGAKLFARDAEAVAANDQGYVTSVGYSPTLGQMLGLGFLTHGRDRHGEEIRLVDHLRNVETPCRVVDPVFFDPEGGRARD